MSTFTAVNESVLAEAIGRCRSRMVYIAPGVTEVIVEAMKKLLQRPKSPPMTVIIDADPEVCRLGYGTVDGLKALQALAAASMIPIRYQPGLRIGLLVHDDDMLVYAPTPLLIEAGAKHPEEANALNLSEEPLLSVLHASAADGSDDPNAQLPGEAEVGNRAATPELLRKSLEDLERLPPKPYDVARVERVYSSKLQYVDLEVTGYKLAERRVRVPNDLLLNSDDAVNQRLRNSFSLLEGKEALVVDIPDVDLRTGEPKLRDGEPMTVAYSQAGIEHDRKKIYEDFLIAVPGHGQLISRTRRKAFDDRVAWFTARVQAYSEGVREELGAAIDKSIANLTDALLPGLLERPPARLMKHAVSATLSEKEMRHALHEELERAFDAADGFYQPQVKVVFKDLTYETIKDQTFRGKLKSAFPGLGDQDVEALFDEHDAARESARVDRQCNH